MRPGPAAIAWLAVLALACALRMACFQSYPSGWDSCEYVYVVEYHLLPHSAYVIHVWLGMLVSLVVPVGAALSAISFVAGIAVVMLTGALVGHLSESKPAGIIAAGAMAGFPVCVWYSSIQEVYTLQSALVLGALYAAARNRPAPIVGLLFGLAAGAHSGTVFFVPAMVLLVVTGERDEPFSKRVSYLLEMGTVTAAVLALCYGWVYWIGDWDRFGGAGAFLDYLAGISPPRNPHSELPQVVRRFLFHSIDKAVAVSLTSMSLLGLSALFLFVNRRLRYMAIWFLVALPYSIYHFSVDPQVEGGIAMVYIVPALAAIPGAAAGILLGRLSAARHPGGRLDSGRVLAASASSLILVVFVAAPSIRTLVMVGQVPSRAQFLASGVNATLMALRGAVPADSVIIQPAEVSNVNLAPCLSGLRPVIFQDMTYRITPPGRWVPMHLPLLVALRDDHLDNLLREGKTIVSLTPDVFARSRMLNTLALHRYRWRELRLGTAGPGAVYVLQMSNAPGG